MEPTTPLPSLTPSIAPTNCIDLPDNEIDFCPVPGWENIPNPTGSIFGDITVYGGCDPCLSAVINAFSGCADQYSNFCQSEYMICCPASAAARCMGNTAIADNLDVSQIVSYCEKKGINDSLTLGGLQELIDTNFGVTIDPGLMASQQARNYYLSGFDSKGNRIASEPVGMLPPGGGM
jgi:hypothetical protein